MQLRIYFEDLTMTKLTHRNRNTVFGCLREL